MADQSESIIALPALRAQISDKWVPDLREMLTELLASHYSEAIDLVRDGRMAALQEEALPRWRREMREAKRPFYYAMAQDGYDWAGAEFGDQGFIDRLGGKEWTEPEIDPELMHRRTREHVDEFIDDLTYLETDTTAQQVADQYNALRSDPAVLTNRQIAQELTDHFENFSLNRARNITRTSTIWTYNQGARQQYADQGVRAAKWMVTGDDRTCEFCIPLDGKRVGMSEKFHKEGDQITGLQGGSLNVAWGVDHPPLHAFCRCTLVPVIE